MIKVSMWEIKPMFWAHINWAARRRSAFAIATLVVLQLHPSLAQEPQALVPSSMEGVVLDAVKGEPLARAQVTLTRI
ncbi:MAG TPA: hypothetical protein VMT78_05020, partial [Terriglobia bacterium]|nr:hypothetical protein [Terriglobia bacterium]